ncbi:MAG: SHOCT domain-containing protein [bacterium]|nr:SHOCT domain-containing protein [bacterium]
MSRLDDALAQFQHNPKVPATYDSLVDKLPIGDDAKATARDTGRAVGSGFMVGLRKITAALEGAIDGGLDAARSPLSEPEAPAGPPSTHGERPYEGEGSSSGTVETDTAAGLMDELERLDRLHREGSLTDEEYSLAKARLLS